MPFVSQLAALTISQFVYNVFFHPLAGFPGPLHYRGSELPKIFHQIRGDINDKLLEFHEKYGPVVRLAPGELTFTTSGAVRDIYEKNHGLPPDESLGKRENSFFGATSLLWLADHNEHMRHRKVLSPSFSTASLDAQEPIITGYIDLLMQRFRERAGQPIDMWAWFNYTTFDIIGDLTFGESFGGVRDAGLHPWIKFIFSNLHMMMFSQIVSRLEWLGGFIDLCIPKRLREQMEAHAQSTRDKVDRRRMRDTDRPDFITGILKYVDQPGGITSNELYADSQIFLMAGSETSATLLAVAVYYLLRTPAVLARLQQEVRSVFSSESEIRFNAVSKIPFVKAVINEALRIHPPLPSGINRRVPAGGATVEGHFLPEGTVLQVPHWATFHLEANFADPWSFAPERWLEKKDCEACKDATDEDCGNCQHRNHKFGGDNEKVFRPFSAGSRNCMGRSLAYMETRMILARLIWNFDMELMPDSLDWNKQRVFLLYEKRPLQVKLTPVCRDTDLELKDLQGDVSQGLEKEVNVMH